VHADPIVHCDMITAEGFMQYLLGLWHPGWGGYLGKSSYGNKHASLNHIFHVHNWIGMPADLCSHLTNLYQSFFCSLAQNNPIHQAAGPNDEAGEEGIPEPCIYGEGKAAMSVALYCVICNWLLEFGTADGLFAHFNLVLTWNLACQSQNTLLIQIKHIVWASCFDAFQVFFGHLKTDQLVKDLKYPHHIYARVKQALQEYGLNSEQITVDALQWLLDEFRDQISMQLQHFNVGGSAALAGPAD